MSAVSQSMAPRSVGHFANAGNQTFVPMVSAWATHHRVVLGEFRTEEKSNEITAIPKLLELFQVKSAAVTIDAMGCQKDVAAKIVEEAPTTC